MVSKTCPEGADERLSQLSKKVGLAGWSLDKHPRGSFEVLSFPTRFLASFDLNVQMIGLHVDGYSSDLRLEFKPGRAEVSVLFGNVEEIGERSETPDVVPGSVNVLRRPSDGDTSVGFGQLTTCVAQELVHLLVL